MCLVKASEYTSSAFLQSVCVAPCYVLIDKISPSLSPSFLPNCLLATDPQGPLWFSARAAEKAGTCQTWVKFLGCQFVLEASMEHV